jgi:hypothetical protein
MNPDSEGTLARITEEILLYSGKMLNTETLDKILAIDELENFDSKRLKRSRMVTEINKKYKQIHNKDLIKRSKNPDDRRPPFKKEEVKLEENSDKYRQSSKAGRILKRLNMDLTDKEVEFRCQLVSSEEFNQIYLKNYMGNFLGSYKKNKKLRESTGKCPMGF